MEMHCMQVPLSRMKLGFMSVQELYLSRQVGIIPRLDSIVLVDAGKTLVQQETRNLLLTTLPSSYQHSTCIIKAESAGNSQ